MELDFVLFVLNDHCIELKVHQMMKDLTVLSEGILILSFLILIQVLSDYMLDLQVEEVHFKRDRLFERLEVPYSNGIVGVKGVRKQSLPDFRLAIKETGLI